MKSVMLPFVAIMLAGALFAPAKSDAAEKLRKNETWCLQTSIGAGDEGGGGTRMECNYETEAQCKMGKVANSDTCWLNPRLRAR